MVGSWAKGQDSKASLDLSQAERLLSNNPEEAYRQITAWEREQSDLSSIAYGKGLMVKGKLLYQLGLYEEALGPLYEAEVLFRKNECLQCIASSHNLLGKLYYKIKSAEEALQRHEAALEIYESLMEHRGISETKAYIGAMHEKMGNYSLALEYQNQAFEGYRKGGTPGELAFVMENIGSIYEDREMYDSAYRYFRLSYQYNLLAGDSTSLIGNLNNLGDVFRKSGKLDSAVWFSSLALELSQRQNNNYQLRSALVDLAKVSALAGRYEEGFSYLEEARQVSEQLFSEETARQLALKEAQYEVNQKIAQINHLKEVSHSESRIRWLLIFTIFTLISLAWTIFNRQKLKLKNGKELLSRQNELLEIKERLIATEKENINLLEARMAAEVEAQSKAVTAQTLHVLEKNQMLMSIQDRLKKVLEEDPKDQKKKIRNLIKQIDYNFSQDTDWEEFKSSFEKVHQDFFKKLNENGQELTPGELKLASLMRMNLNSKEIASTLGISQDSLRISRYRLRKKLNLEKGTSLQQFLLCI
ncbi:tetratricopeptide repeat protein [Algoriphagus confluentis]|uniref:HTH luxR-type domain-containing protein n=1 Tax=Algoriphagus confluentis TaxID=1697556 RepID=A0ABQ6PPJ8_9BACT|nr:hypothetical protein Aconfl_18030 [Algoriphagus confluentis]